MKRLMVVYGDGVHDETEAIQAHVLGEADLIHPDGTLFLGAGKTYKITSPIKFSTPNKSFHSDRKSRSILE